jgi:DNA-binding NarL/FixJ family response regulator
MTIKVLIADDQALIRAGLTMLLDAQPDLEVVAEAADGAEAVRLAELHRVDVVLMDVRMPSTDGVAATRALCADRRSDDPAPGPKVLILTTFDDDDAVYGALSAGASGYLLKHAVPHDLLAAIRRVAAGDAWLDPAVAGSVIAALARGPRPGEPVPDILSRLTPREREVLVLIAEGLSNAEIADRLVVGEGTVKTHVSRVLMKTASRDRSQAVALAYRSGLVLPPR